MKTVRNNYFASIKNFHCRRVFLLSIQLFWGIYICILCQTCKALFRINIGFEQLLKTKNQKSFQPGKKIVWQPENKRKRRTVVCVKSNLGECNGPWSTSQYGYSNLIYECLHDFAEEFQSQQLEILNTMLDLKSFLFYFLFLCCS